MTSDLQIENPQINVTIDRDKASALGVTARRWRTRSTRLRPAPGLDHLRAHQYQYRVIMEVEPEFQRDPDALVAALRALVDRAAGAA